MVGVRLRSELAERREVRGEGRRHTLSVFQETPSLPTSSAGWVHLEVTCLTLQEGATSLLKAVRN